MAVAAAVRQVVPHRDWLVEEAAVVVAVDPDTDTDTERINTTATRSRTLASTTAAIRGSVNFGSSISNAVSTAADKAAAVVVEALHRRRRHHPTRACQNVVEETS